MEKILEKFKNENKILLMLAFFSISKGLWENFRQLWLQDNNLNATEISQILGTATFCCVIILIILAKQLSLDRIKKIISISIFIKIISLIALYILNHTGDSILINLFIILDTICEKIIIISIYPFIVSIKKDDKLYSKRKLVEYLFSDIGILIGGILIGRTIGNLIVDYNICLLVAVIFLILSFIVVINIKNIKASKEKVELKKTIQYIIKDKIIVLYILDYMISNIAMNTGLGLKMLMLTNSLNFSAGEATNFLLAVGLIADVIGIMALKYFTPKNDYLTITIKFGIRMMLYWIAFISNDLTMCLIAMTWSILISTAYENITDAPYINRIKNEYQMVFTNVRYTVGLVGTSIGLYFAGIMYNYGIAFNLGLSAFFVLFQLALTYYLVYLRKKENNLKKVRSENEI